MICTSPSTMTSRYSQFVHLSSLPSVQDSSSADEVDVDVTLTDVELFDAEVE
jgi:hypothetical protein